MLFSRIEEQIRSHDLSGRYMKAAFLCRLRTSAAIPRIIQKSLLNFLSVHTHRQVSVTFFPVTLELINN